MVVFPNCKINLGLHVVEKRQDGFHNIETVFYPVKWCDALEVIENTSSTEQFKFSQSGLSIDVVPEQNILYKTWKLVSEVAKFPNIQVHLHKNIPMGAGLGGGSANAAFFINLLDSKFNLQLPDSKKFFIASQLGSDCSFFINNKPVFASGKGDEFQTISCDLSSYYILVVMPPVHSNTREAYDGLTPVKPQKDLKDLVERLPVKDWKGLIKNDFELSIFKKYPSVKTLKESLYENGAVYASMSGSGSAVYGIFENNPEIRVPDDYRYFLQMPDKKIL
ncbi:MAG: 4-(cytidine 5'-diphospho)-2-C-methyl-D-erythritol kinase [Bacteroidia bacterium]|nr:4-(cytidine 5'-diphospho)-2-C-methyl-D-erythritol kinase [Bacteroidia bacterium]